MAHPTLPPGRPGGWRPSLPWFLVGGGLAATLLGLACIRVPQLPEDASFLGQALLAVGLIVAGGAVSMRLRSSGQALEERAESAGIVALAAFAALVAFLAMKEPWDSGRYFFGALSGVGLVGAVLVLLPRVARRIVASLLVLYHFGGILSAVTCVPSPGFDAPWISLQLWTRVYRPYLMFAYLNNAYHFYSPDPGPATILYFRIQYEDNSSLWVKIPDRDESDTRLGYQRLLALTESTTYKADVVPPDWAQRLERRQAAGHLFKPDLTLNPNGPIGEYYGEPSELAKRLIANYAKHVALSHPHPHNEAVGVARVKVYRVLQRILAPKDMADGYHPNDKTLYLPYFMGEFDREGTLKDPNEPFLYWYLPIYYEGQSNGYVPGQGPPPKGAKLINCMEIHAGDGSPAEEKQP
jgi:hypothetical protein